MQCSACMYGGMWLVMCDCMLGMVSDVMEAEGAW